MNLALVLRSRGLLDDARQELLAAAEDSRAKPQAVLQQGYIELEDGRYALGLELLQEAQERLGDSTEVLNLMGEAALRLGRNEQALSYWRRSLELDRSQARLAERVRNLESNR